MPHIRDPLFPTSSLPPELCREVAGHLRAPNPSSKTHIKRAQEDSDLANLCLVSRLWFGAAHRVLWSEISIDLENLEDELQRRKLEFLGHAYAMHVRYFKLHCQQHREISHEWEGFLRDIFRDMPLIETLDIIMRVASAQSRNVVLSIINDTPFRSLRKLGIRIRPQTASDIALVAEFLRAHSELVELYLQVDAVSPFSTPLPNPLGSFEGLILPKLLFVDCHPTMLHILDTPNHPLESITLRREPDAAERRQAYDYAGSLEKLGCWQNVKTLAVKDGRQALDLPFVSFLENHFPNLESITWNHMRPETFDSIREACRKRTQFLPHLKLIHFDVDQSDFDTTPRLSPRNTKILVALPKLKQIFPGLEMAEALTSKGPTDLGRILQCRYEGDSCHLTRGRPMVLKRRHY